MNRKRKLGLFTLLILIGLLTIVLFQARIKTSLPTKNNDNLRIGYINLNKSKVSETDLNKLIKFNCDLWLFAEWNGNNFDNQPIFESNYTTLLEKVDSLTYGFLILSNNNNFTLSEIGNKEAEYQCNYSKHYITNQEITIGLLHAPPPVQTCNFETLKYIEDAINDFNTSTTDSNLLIGDLNCLPSSQSYKTIKENHFKDAFESKGMFEGTFGFSPKMPKFLRIDYCFYKGKLKPLSAQRFETTLDWLSILKETKPKA